MITILPQPSDTTCGPTCLHAVYNHYGDTPDLHTLVDEIQALPTGGTLAVTLGCHALRRGYRVTIYTYNLEVFDPTWFGDPSPEALAERLREQARVKPDVKLQHATDHYLDFLALGGELRHEELGRDLLFRLLDGASPVLTGLSATYLYGAARERHDLPDPVAGSPVGHFVVLCSADGDRDEVDVADPMGEGTPFDSHHYRVGLDRLIGAILLGVMTYDANLMVVRPE